jgi:hypothetical protein
MPRFYRNAGTSAVEFALLAPFLFFGALVAADTVTAPLRLWRAALSCQRAAEAAAVSGAAGPALDGVVEAWWRDHGAPGFALDADVIAWGATAAVAGRAPWNADVIRVSAMEKRPLFLFVVAGVPARRLRAEGWSLRLTLAAGT